MHLLNVTLEDPSGVSCVIYGNFSMDANSDAEVVVVRGNNTLELYQLSSVNEEVKLRRLAHKRVFGVIRALLPFRLPGDQKDYIVVGSDSGKITICEISADFHFLIKHQETFGKTGCRRITPGEYLAVDPKGRAIMIGAIEKQKLVYVMNRDASNRLTISSPLEAHRSSAIHFSIVGLDVGFENPLFASLELDYSDADQDPTGTIQTDKVLVFYELDLGLNHVTRRWSDVVDRSSNLLIPVPGGTDGPGGVLVCAENAVHYKNENHADLSCALPIRNYKNADQLRSQVMITSFATHKQSDLFFVLLQTELGDLFKLSLEYTVDEENSVVTEMKIKYFDTIPCSKQIVITKNGFLFSGSEFGDHYLFQFQGIGENEETAECTNNDMVEQKFDVRKVTNLVVVDTLSSLSPLTNLHVADLTASQAPQLYSLCGRGSERSSLRILRHGLAMTEMAVSELPGVPTAVWSLRGQGNSEGNECFDEFIVVAFSNATLVLGVGETVEEVTDSGILSTASTLLVTRLEDDSIVQIYPYGIRHIRINQPFIEWKPPGKKVIEKCTANARQVVVSLAGGEILYFELEEMTLKETKTLDLGMEISCLDIGVVEKNRLRFPFLAVGGWDNTVRILSLDPNPNAHSSSGSSSYSNPLLNRNMFNNNDNPDVLRQKGTIALSCHAQSLCLVEMNGLFYLNIGLANGVFQRTEIDRLTGSLSQSKTRFLGTKPIKLFRLSRVSGNSGGVLALSSRSWLSFVNEEQNMELKPLCYDSLEYASSFTSEQCPEGIVAITSNTLRIISVAKLTDTFNQQKIPLTYTPRRMVVHDPSNKLIIIESDHNVMNNMAESYGHQNPYKQQSKPVDDDEEDDEEDFNLSARGPIPNVNGSWCSVIRLIDPMTKETLQCLPLEKDEAAVSISCCSFKDRGREVFVLIGTVTGLNLKTGTHQTASIKVYRVVEGSQLVILHSTTVEQIPYAIVNFQARQCALVGVGPVLRIYELGKKKLLRKCENKTTFPNRIVKIQVAGDRIIASDIQESVHYLKYKPNENILVTFADDAQPRFITDSVLLDYDTVAGGDKFGNLFVSRLPRDVSDDVAENPTGNRILWDSGMLNGAPNKLEHLCQFHVGEVITSICRTALMNGGQEALVYTTIYGRIGALLPLASKEDVDFFTHLEMYMRQENPPLCGRDHLSYRSYFLPVKNVTDGELCEEYLTLSKEKQKTIATDLDRTVSEVAKKIEDARNRLM